MTPRRRLLQGIRSSSPGSAAVLSAQRMTSGADAPSNQSAAAYFFAAHHRTMRWLLLRSRSEPERLIARSSVALRSRQHRPTFAQPPARSPTVLLAKAVLEAGRAPDLATPSGAATKLGHSRQPNSCGWIQDAVRSCAIPNRGACHSCRAVRSASPARRFARRSSRRKSRCESSFRLGQVVLANGDRGADAPVPRVR